MNTANYNSYLRHKNTIDSLKTQWTLQTYLAPNFMWYDLDPTEYWLQEFFEKYQNREFSVYNILLWMMYRDLKMWGILEPHLDRIIQGLSEEYMQDLLLYYIFFVVHRGTTVQIWVWNEWDIIIVRFDEAWRVFETNIPRHILTLNHYIWLLYMALPADLNYVKNDRISIALGKMSKLWLTQWDLKKTANGWMIIGHRSTKVLSLWNERKKEKEFMYGKIWFKYSQWVKKWIYQEFHFILE